MDQRFISTCRGGNLRKAKRLYSLGEKNHSKKVNINANNDEAFKWSCNYNNIKMAKWLYSLGTITNANIDEAFTWSCSYGHKEIVQWLYSLGANIHAGNDLAFEWSCYNNKKEIINWLLKVGKFDDELINNCSRYYYRDTIKLIFDKGYKPLNEQMNKYYKEYIVRKQKIKENVVKYMVPELVDLVYDYE